MIIYFSTKQAGRAILLQRPLLKASTRRRAIPRHILLLRETYI